MPASRHRIRALAVGVGAFALVAVGVGGTVAASNPATLYACYDNYGNVRMGDTAQCKLPGGGRVVSWSTAGVPGPTGATGPQGPTGPRGGTGASGPVGGYQIVTDSGFVPISAQVSLVEFTATCPAGKKVVGGGGGATLYTNSPLSLEGFLVTLSSQPGGGGDTTWTVLFARNGGAPLQTTESTFHTVYAICADVTTP
jgi:hypothetical protein